MHPIDENLSNRPIANLDSSDSISPASKTSRESEPIVDLPPLDISPETNDAALIERVQSLYNKSGAVAVVGLILLVGSIALLTAYLALLSEHSQQSVKGEPVSHSMSTINNFGYAGLGLLGGIGIVMGAGSQEKKINKLFKEHPGLHEKYKEHEKQWRQSLREQRRELREKNNPPIQLELATSLTGPIG